ncbi:hypothetical protein NVV95_16465 [Herbiconiux sp. CPCC 205716]|uniref:Uncharacterized protein n=1 Tax=Herbiconiux gentiana TaxID=2970912 RepID=A0ABT2GIT4_9MICO|nr:hypothetical protein [Herbiconiux gentiana]MCS5716141.1 hypothetical protein [Herbiconiux gentiana]
MKVGGGVLAIVPDPWVAGTRLIGTGSDDGVPSEASVEVRSATGSAFTVRTLVRLGERLGSGGHPHGTMTDAVSIAALAAGSLMLQAIPPGLPREETRKRMDAAAETSQSLARDRSGWAFLPMQLAGITYALWCRSHCSGFIAHADLGSHVMAAWGEGDVPPELSAMQFRDLGTTHAGSAPHGSHP